MSYPFFEIAYHIFLKAFHAAQEYNPDYLYSMRDLSNAAIRYSLSASKPEYKNIYHEVMSACLREFSGSIFDKEKREAFQSKLMEAVNISVQAPQATNMVPYGDKENPLYLPPERKYFIDGIRELIRNYEKWVTQKEKSSYFKPGMLVEGESGMGKTTLFKEIAKEMGYVEFTAGSKKIDKASSSQKYFYMLAAGEKIDKGAIDHILSHGGILIVEEPNANPDITKMLIDICDNNPKVLILASQNPISEAGLFETADAVKNRLQAEYIPDFSHKELESIARQDETKIGKRTLEEDEVQDVVTAFEEARASHPEIVNIRTFREALNIYKKPPGKEVRAVVAR